MPFAAGVDAALTATCAHIDKMPLSSQPQRTPGPPAGPLSLPRAQICFVYVVLCNLCGFKQRKISKKQKGEQLFRCSGWRCKKHSRFTFLLPVCWRHPSYSPHCCSQGIEFNYLLGGQKTCNCNFYFRVTPSEQKGDLGSLRLHPGITSGQGMVVEAWLTFMLMQTIWGSINSKRKRVLVPSLLIGLAYAVTTIAGVGYRITKTGILNKFFFSRTFKVSASSTGPLSPFLHPILLLKPKMIFFLISSGTPVQAWIQPELWVQRWSSTSGTITGFVHFDLLSGFIMVDSLRKENLFRIELKKCFFMCWRKKCNFDIILFFYSWHRHVFLLDQSSQIDQLKFSWHFPLLIQYWAFFLVKKGKHIKAAYPSRGSRTTMTRMTTRTTARSTHEGHTASWEQCGLKSPLLCCRFTGSAPYSALQWPPSFSVSFWTTLTHLNSQTITVSNWTCATLAGLANLNAKQWGKHRGWQSHPTAAISCEWLEAIPDEIGPWCYVRSGLHSAFRRPL